MSHYHHCDACDGWFVCEAPELADRCSVEPTRCPICEEARQYQRSGEPDLNAAGASEQIARGYDFMNARRR